MKRNILLVSICVSIISKLVFAAAGDPSGIQCARTGGVNDVKLCSGDQVLLGKYEWSTILSLPGGIVEKISTSPSFQDESKLSFIKSIELRGHEQEFSNSQRMYQASPGACASLLADGQRESNYYVSVCVGERYKDEFDHQDYEVVGLALHSTTAPVLVRTRDGQNETTFEPGEVSRKIELSKTGIMRVRQYKEETLVSATIKDELLEKATNALRARCAKFREGHGQLIDDTIKNTSRCHDLRDSVLSNIIAQHFGQSCEVTVEAVCAE
jgi:hypothetical protein